METVFDINLFVKLFLCEKTFILLLLCSTPSPSLKRFVLNFSFFYFMLGITIIALLFLSFLCCARKFELHKKLWIVAVFIQQNRQQLKRSLRSTVCFRNFVVGFYVCVLFNVWFKVTSSVSREKRRRNLRFSKSLIISLFVKRESKKRTETGLGEQFSGFPHSNRFRIWPWLR